MNLNLGCGRRPIPGYVNADLYPAEGVDVVFDAEHFPWPWPDASFSKVHASQVLEHLGPLPTIMREIHRILIPGGTLIARVPYGLRWLYDPSHKHAFNKRTLRAYIANNDGLQSARLFVITREEFTDWEMPFRWHVAKYLPSIHRLITEEGWDGKTRLRYPLGRRMELTVTMQKLETVP